jgi:hypothetical protein
MRRVLLIYLCVCTGKDSPASAFMVLHTKFSKAFGIDLPIVGAPMAGVSGSALTAAVAQAGGLGLIGSAFAKDGDELRRYGPTPRRRSDSNT